MTIGPLNHSSPTSPGATSSPSGSTRRTSTWVTGLPTEPGLVPRAAGVLLHGPGTGLGHAEILDDVEAVPGVGVKQGDRGRRPADAAEFEAGEVGALEIRMLAHEKIVGRHA